MSRRHVMGRIGKHEAAIEALLEKISLNESCCEAWNDLAVAYLATNSCQAARLCCDRSLSIDPNSRNAWFNKGQALFGMERPADAIHYYEGAIRRDPSLWRIAPVLGQVRSICGGNTTRYKTAR